MQILIPAAGSSSRMQGRDKLAEVIDGVAFLRRTTLRALATGTGVAGAGVIVTLRESDPRRVLIADLPITIRDVPEASEGLAASLRHGAKGAGVLMILPADMPDLTTDDLTAMIACHKRNPEVILRATDADGTPGHPVIFPADLRRDFDRLTGDAGARAILQAHAGRLVLFALPGQHATTDLDTPAAWAAWRAARGEPAPSGAG